jgi:hypothetical protein
MIRAATIGLSVALWVFVIPPFLSWVLPASHWYSVGRVFVEDGNQGTPPKITVDRTVKRPFRGSWEAELRREDGATFAPTECRRFSPGAPFNYKPERSIPDDADLRWWLSIPPNRDCDWEPGRYILVTKWLIYLPAWVTLEVENTSNTFTIFGIEQWPTNP